jgi:hypothetical protein
MLLPNPAPFSKPTLGPIFEKASTDDLLWLSPCSIDQVTSLIMEPNRWITELNALDPNDTFITLRKDFLMRLNLHGMPKVMPPDGQDCLVQGIVGTSMITVRPRIALTGHVGEDWDSYWLHWQEHGLLDVTYVPEFGQGYAHIQLTEETDTPGVRADKIAAFLMLGADPRKTFAGDLYLNMILKKIPRSVTAVIGGVATSIPPTQAMFVPVTEETLANVDFSMIANTDELTKNVVRATHNLPPPLPAPACNNTSGTLNPGGLIIIDDVVVKNYAEPTNP